MRRFLDWLVRNLPEYAAFVFGIAALELAAALGPTSMFEVSGFLTFVLLWLSLRFYGYYVARRYHERIQGVVRALEVAHEEFRRAVAPDVPPVPPLKKSAMADTWRNVESWDD